MIRILATAMVAAGLLAAPALAQGNATTNSTPMTVQHATSGKHSAAVKAHHAKKHAAVHHRKHAKHVKHVKRHVKHQVKTTG